MKKKLIAVFATLALLVVPVLAFSGTAFADNNFRSGESVVVKEGETVDRTLYAAGTNVDIAGTVNGDVFCVGQNITVSGTVKGDVICAGQTVRVEGSVEGDVRLAGQTVTLNAEVSGNATVASQSFTLENGARVRDLTAMGSSTVLNGEVTRDANVAGQATNLNSTVGRNVEAAGTTLVLGEKSETGGNVTFYSERNAERRDGAQVAGQLTRKDPPRDDTYASKDMGWTAGGIIFVFLAILAAAMAIAALFPRMLQNVSENGVAKPGTSALIGLGVLFLTPIFVIALLLTGIGFILGLLLLMAYLLLLVLSGPVFSYYIGRLLVRNTTSNPLLYMLLGATIVTLLYFLPIIGGLTMLVAGLMGSGMLVREVMRSGKPTYDFTGESVRPAKTTRAKK